MAKAKMRALTARHKPRKLNLSNVPAPKKDGKSRVYFRLQSVGPVTPWPNPMRVWILPSSEAGTADAKILAMEADRNRRHRAYESPEHGPDPELDEINRLSDAITRARPGTAKGLEPKFRLLFEYVRDYNWGETHEKMLRAIRADVRRLLPGGGAK